MREFCKAAAGVILMMSGAIQFAAAAEIRDVITAKDEGGRREPLLKTIHAGGLRNGKDVQTRIRGYSRLSIQSGSLYSNLGDAISLDRSDLQPSPIPHERP